jgi:hypothetical protein
MRTTFNKDVTSGVIDVDDGLTTVGPASVFHIKNEVPEWPESKCYIRQSATCTTEQYAQVMNGTVLVKDWIVLEYGVEPEENIADTREAYDLHTADGSQRILKDL